MPTKFYIDNNFFRLITAASNSAMLEDWRAHISQARIVPAELIVTHFSLLEGLGIVPEEIPPFGGSLKGMAPGDIGIAIFDHALNFLNSSKIISLDHFRNRYQECAARCSQEGRSSFSECFDTRSADIQFIEDTRKALALDFMQAYHYPNSIFVPVHMVFWLQMVELWQKNGDYPSLRLFTKMYNRIPRKRLWLIMAKDYLSRVLKNIGLKERQDLMDLELIQFVVIGAASTSGRLPVHAHTGDPAGKIKDRIALSKTVLTTIKERFEENAMDASVFSTFKCGFVHCYDLKTGNHLETIDVGAIGHL